MSVEVFQSGLMRNGPEKFRTHFFTVIVTGTWGAKIEAFNLLTNKRRPETFCNMYLSTTNQFFKNILVQKLLKPWSSTFM